MNMDTDTMERSFAMENKIVLRKLDDGRDGVGENWHIVVVDQLDLWADDDG